MSYKATVNKKKAARLRRERAANERRKWYLLELNQGHMDFQSIALPPELRYHYYNISRSLRLISKLRVQR